MVIIRLMIVARPASTAMAAAMRVPTRLLLGDSGSVNDAFHIENNIKRIIERLGRFPGYPGLLDMNSTKVIGYHGS